MNTENGAITHIEDEQMPTVSRRRGWGWDILLVVILVLAAYFRFIGLDWDDDHHLHPDERFLTMVESSISPVDSISEYFNTEQSSLNPNNRGYGFYVYGTLPLFTVRYIAEWVHQTGYSEVYLVGRFVSATADLLTVLLVYLIAESLYRKKVISLLAAVFSAFSVLQIQLSHYFTVDIFANLFAALTFYLAVRILQNPKIRRYSHWIPSDDASEPAYWRAFVMKWPTILPYLLFGISFGMAVASKISSAPLAILLPGAVLINYLRLPAVDRKRAAAFFIRNMVAAGLVSIIVFRIFQPYAFNGPGFLGFIPNNNWLESLKQLSGQSGGNVDFPPALQWARRPFLYGFENLVLWGLGLPLGILASVGFLWMGYRIIKGEWFQHSLIWGWTAIYFLWQSLNFTSSMRYFILIYPMLQVMAAWLVIQIWGKVNSQPRKINWRKIAAVLVGGIVLLSTLAYAFAFSRIYTRPVTRIAASEWIYQNVPAPINLHIRTDEGITNQPLAYPLVSEVSNDQPTILAFQAQYSGSISEINFSHLLALNNEAPLVNFTAWISDQRENPRALTTATIASSFPASPSDPRGSEYQMNFVPYLKLNAGQTYYLFLETLDLNSRLQIAGPIDITILYESEIFHQSLLSPVKLLDSDTDYSLTVSPVVDGQLTEIFFPHIVDFKQTGANKILEISLLNPADQTLLAQTQTIESGFLTGEDPRGQSFVFQLEQPVALKAGEHITLQLKLIEGDGELAFYGSKQMLESTWDDPLPYSLDGYSVFDYYNGLYRTELNVEMYWDDNQEKLDRFYTALDQTDYIFISSSRQWASTVRVPERYPLTTAYYRALIGCPPEQDILWCYSAAEPGQFSGSLGFELVKIFQSEPNIGSFQLNTQFAEEAFTVYDHPKVFIFKKTDQYSSEKVKEILGAVDLSRVIHLTPKEASDNKGNLILSEERWAEQQNAGTWSDLFNRDSLINRYPGIGLLVWYLLISLIGISVYPLTRLVFRGLQDRGYPISKFFGLLILAYLVWLSGSSGIPFTRLTILICFGLLLIINLGLFLAHRKQIVREIRQNWKYILLVELIFLGVFLFDLFIRLGNPDLWHPYKGGEKPMDFSYFNAVLKSTSFPPYDPWFEGGYINYYYYGFVLVGVPVKWLGIVPAYAYNLILPTLMAFLSMGTFCAGFNLITLPGKSESPATRGIFSRGFLGMLGGIITTVFMILLGNLGTIRMIWHGIMRLAAPGGIEDSNIFARLSWTVQGIGKYLSGSSLPYGFGDWYWIPSRVYPNEPITEFPLFTFLYADLHAHMIALPITVLALCFVISIIRLPNIMDNRTRSRWLLNLSLILGFGALIIGTLRPTNTWDLPTYLVLGIVAVIYSLVGMKNIPDLQTKSHPLRKALLITAFTGGMVALTFILYYPFAKWYAQGYNSIQFWKGDHSPFWSYITHWGLFLFVILSWMTWETRDWLASTPVSALTRLKPYRGLIQFVLILLVAAVIALLISGVGIGWLVLPAAFWAGVLLFRPGLSDMKRLVLFMTGSALVLTLFVELVVLEGDIGRMNTVFKFYLQAWTLFSISAGAALVWLYPNVIRVWRPTVRTIWQISLAFLVGSAALFTLFGGIDKIRDRMSKDAPHTLDGMAFMPYSEYSESGVTMDLAQDYQAILWMQENIEGTPVIVEANTPEYRWGSRFTIYTGLPGVVGWNWHQRQQRGVVSTIWVTDRVEEIGEFYRTLDRDHVEAFLRKYQVKYIVVGQLEKAYYAGAGLEKFDFWNQDLWIEVYHNQDTTIYQVVGQN